MAASSRTRSRRQRQRIDWATLHRRTFGSDVLQCPCGGRRKVTALQSTRKAAQARLAELRVPCRSLHSTHVVVTEHFVVKVPKGLDPATAALVLCAGVTTYSPLRQWKVGPGDRVAVVGLGHMGVKLAAAMGADVTVLSTSASKETDARRLGATDFAVTEAEPAWSAQGPGQVAARPAS